MAEIRGRLAPSPTGLLHLGNAWAFFWNWLYIRSLHGTMILRIEDIDPQRCRQEFINNAIQDLHWLGLDWDEGPDVGGSCGPYEQSRRVDLYAEALERLNRQNLCYPCFCTRRELRSIASAPHSEDLGVFYPGTCATLSPEEQHRFFQSGRHASMRFRCPDTRFAFTDQVCGSVQCTLQECGGDFVLRRSDGVFAYHLAVAIDDGAMRMTHIVRGRDLLFSTPRHLALQSCLGFPHPVYLHLPLLCDTEGERLAKRHGSLSLHTLRQAGVSPEQIAGWFAFQAGLTESLRSHSAAALISRFDLKYLRHLPEIVRIHKDMAAFLKKIV
ncbi:MAG: tRNA glutamyl-Q(34) synthetase GluQRS [Desulfovibrionaceae bacterium]|nr:tRNA glutamyl-Q(34) synthetase GluQRS [Desulfovibrionaceae bacterium]